MKRLADIDAMANNARVHQMHANDLRLIGGISAETAAERRAFAEGAEAALLWVMGHIGDIGFPPIQLRPPTDISDEGLDNLPGISKEEPK